LDVFTTFTPAKTRSRSAQPCFTAVLTFSPFPLPNMLTTLLGISQIYWLSSCRRQVVECHGKQKHGSKPWRADVWIGLQ